MIVSLLMKMRMKTFVVAVADSYTAFVFAEQVSGPFFVVASMV